MTSGFTQTFLVTPARQAVGLTSVALGIVRALQRLGVDAGFAKPVVAGHGGALKLIRTGTGKVATRGLCGSNCGPTRLGLR